MCVCAFAYIVRICVCVCLCYACVCAALLQITPVERSVAGGHDNVAQWCEWLVRQRYMCYTHYVCDPLNIYFWFNEIRSERQKRWSLST